MRKMTKHQIIASVEAGHTVETAIPEPAMTTGRQSMAG